MKKLTKRQILNELLVIEEKKAAITKSSQRLQARRNKVTAAHCNLAEQLEAICEEEQIAAGNEDDVYKPIVFKNHIFEVDTGGYMSRTTVDIQGAKSVK